MPPVKSKVKLNYHIVKRHEECRCSNCGRCKTVTIPGKKRREYRCAPIGLDDNRKYRLEPNGCCDSFKRGR